MKKLQKEYGRYEHIGHKIGQIIDTVTALQKEVEGLKQKDLAQLHWNDCISKHTGFLQPESQSEWCTCEKPQICGFMGGSKHKFCIQCGHAVNPLPSSEVRKTEVMGAVARGWCHEKNAHKVMDTDLAMAITEEILKLIGRGV